MLNIIEYPSESIISLDELKMQLGMELDCGLSEEDQATLDGYLQDAIDTATEDLENETNRAIMPQTWLLSLNHFSCRIQLPKPPLIEVLEIEYTKPDGTTATLTEGDDYSVHVPHKQPGWIELHKQPATKCADNVVRITFICGYGAENEEETIVGNPPALAKWFVRLYAASLFRNREAEIDRTTTMIQLGLERLSNKLNWGCYV